MFGNFSSPTAIGARLKHFLDERSNLLTDTDLALASARAACFQNPTLGSRSFTGSAHVGQINLHFLFASQEDVFKVNGMSKKNI
jgi:hypothetical protein